MAPRPSFGTLKKAKPTLDVVQSSAEDSLPVPKVAPRIQTDPAMWAALNDLATRKRIEGGRRVTVHDLLIEGAGHILAVNGIKQPK
jgi:hypothetical protein